MKSTATSIVGHAQREVGEEDQRALQHADEHDPIGMVGGDLGARGERHTRGWPTRRAASGGARVSDRRGHSASDVADRLAQQRGAQPASERAELDELVLEAGPRFGVALADVRQQHLAEEDGFAFGERAVHAQMACLDPARRRNRPPRCATSSASAS